MRRFKQIYGPNKSEETAISKSQTPASAEDQRAAYRNSTNLREIYLRRILTVLNWALALLSVPGALFVMVFAFAAVMSTDRCAYEYCPRQGPPSSIFVMLLYGGPFVAALTVVASFWTAKRGWGILIPLTALILLASDVTVLYLTFRP
ncbi:MAG: hypothetical protein QJR12_07640 [Mycobacterium sp.]|uniref:hypothetical protein n=1 Tax=Mycobacterium sp. TaxID=1785 RepID=UPI00260C577A|nr:hypothetical protein [Mycobacterium sp.]MDI3314146.1 hypothetical protein [Mycobacterium sp.]